MIGLAVELHAAHVRLYSARDDIHQCALTGPVLAYDRVHLARLEFDVYAVKRNRRAETLLDSR